MSICNNCGYNSIIDMLVPNHVWEVISEGDYCLCPNCMDIRMSKHNIYYEGVAQCHGKALRTYMTPEVTKVILAWRPNPQDVEHSGSIGNPKMHELFPEYLDGIPK